MIDFKKEDEERKAKLEELANKADKRIKEEYHRESRETAIEIVVRADTDVSQSQYALVDGLVSGVLLERKLARRAVNHRPHFVDAREYKNDEIAETFHATSI